MKHFILIAALTSIVQSAAFAQWADIWPNNNNLQGGCFATSSDTAFLTGEAGKIYRTTNGGADWESITSIFTTSWFNDIAFSSTKIGYACGGTAFGTHTSCIAKTTDGGLTWDSLTSNEFGYEFTGISLVSDSVGYFVGESFVKTTDGGKTFSKIPIPFTTHQVAPIIQSVYFSDHNNGVISTREYVNSTKTRFRIAHTTDGGASWTTAYLDSSTASGTARNINAIAFRNALNGYAVGNSGTVLTTVNGGMSWVQSSLLSDSTHFSDVAFSKNSTLGYIVGWKSSGTTTEGRIYKTVDGGLTWTIDLTVPSDRFTSISLSDSTIVYSVSYKDVYKTTAGTVGINPSSKDMDWKVYPNPTEDQLFIQTPHSTRKTIELYSLLGQQVLQIASSDRETRVDLSDCPDGIYFITVWTEGKSFTRKIVKKK